MSPDPRRVSARGPWIALLAALMPGCAMPVASEAEPQAPPPAVPERPITENWRAIALPDDIGRLDRLAAAWQQGLSEARARGFAGMIAAAGPLLDPDAALPRAAPPPGPYRCRVTRLGAGPRRRALTIYPAYFCHVGVEGELLVFTKQDGAERPGGYLFAESDSRMIFLGAMAVGNDPLPPAYGEFAARDLIGVAERIEPLRYRIVFPWPRNGAAIDIYDLVPIPPQIG